MTGKTLMVQGTASHVGKSMVVTAICRLLRNRGVKVAPFKAQNMANNSFVTVDGGEIGRAQATQAEACGIEPSVMMNPVLLKPTTDRKSQVIVLGKPARTLTAMEYQRHKKELAPIVERSLRALIRSYDVVVIEGAGSPAEINLKKHEIVNMAVAKMVSSPVILVGDIDRGGVFAQLIGTYELMDPVEKNLIRAFLINKFRGDKKILDPGLKWIEKKAGVKMMGVLPYMRDHEIPEEDSLALEDGGGRPGSGRKQILIHVVRLPRISNFTDFESLSREKDVRLQYVDRPDRHCLPDLLIIPGSKSTIADLKFLWDSGFAEHIKRCVRSGVPVVGICAGYQMLGERILDPEHVEARMSECEGLGLLPTVTVFRNEKSTARVKAVHVESGFEVEGYEIHMGCTQGRNGHNPLFKIVERHGMPTEDFDGMRSSSVMGTTIHGVFDKPDFRRYFLNQIRKNAGLEEMSADENGRAPVPDRFDTLARTFETHINMKLLEKILHV